MAAAQARGAQAGLGRPFSRLPRWWSSTTRPTGAEWRSLGRSASARVRLQSSSRCWTKWRSWLQEAWCDPTSRTGKRNSRHAEARRNVCHSQPRPTGLNLWLLEVLAACVLCFDGEGLEHGAARSVPGRLAQHRQRQDFRHHGGHVCRRSGGQSSITLCSSSGATGRSCRQLSHHATLASPTHTQSHVLGSQGLGRLLPRARDHRGAPDSQPRPPDDLELA